MQKDPARGGGGRVALAVLGAWTLYGLLNLLMMVWNRPPNIPRAWKPYGPVLVWLGYAWTWAALTPLIALNVRRFPPSLRRPQSLLPHLLALILIHSLLTVVDASTFYFVTSDFNLSWQKFKLGGALTILLYCTVSFAVLALDHARLAQARALRASQLEADLTRARLDTLRRQIQPHFLFNTLNTISELIDSDPARAGVMVTRLGELLRRSLETQQPLVPLYAELDFVRLYTDIERVRFEGWLDVVENVDADAIEAQVPPMILQPLVENAIKHGIAPLKRKGMVTIKAKRSGERLHLEVIDDGVGDAGTRSVERRGIGLTATRERLAHLFPADAWFNFDSQQGRGTRVTMELPYITVSD